MNDHDDDHDEDTVSLIPDDGPAEDDILAEDFGTFYQRGRAVVRDLDNGRWWFSNQDNRPFPDWQSAVGAYCERDQFWPSVWRVSDHGNAETVPY